MKWKLNEMDFKLLSLNAPITIFHFCLIQFHFETTKIEQITISYFLLTENKQFIIFLLNCILHFCHALLNCCSQ